MQLHFETPIYITHGDRYIIMRDALNNVRRYREDDDTHKIFQGIHNNSPVFAKDIVPKLMQSKTNFDINIKNYDIAVELIELLKQYFKTDNINISRAKQLISGYNPDTNSIDLVTFDSDVKIDKSKIVLEKILETAYLCVNLDRGPDEKGFSRYRASLNFACIPDDAVILLYMLDYDVSFHKNVIYIPMNIRQTQIM